MKTHTGILSVASPAMVFSKRSRPFIDFLPLFRFIHISIARIAGKRNMESGYFIEPMFFRFVIFLWDNYILHIESYAKIVKRVVSAFIALFVVVTLTFFLMNLVPGGPAPRHSRHAIACGTMPGYIFIRTDYLEIMTNI